MKLIIDIDEQHFEILQNAVRNGMGDNSQKIIANGTPLDTHDEEIIATTVESIWGKPPYTELLDKIRAEIERLHYHPKLDFIKNDEVVEMALDIINKYSGVSE